MALHKLYQLGEIIAKNRPDVPPTRDELANLGVTKQELKDLERLSLVKSQLMIVDQAGKNMQKTTTGRVVYVLTRLGKEVCAQLGFTQPKDEPTIVIPTEIPVPDQSGDIVFDSIV